MEYLWGTGGVLVLLLLAFALSTDRRAIRPRTVLGALAIQIAFAVLVLATGPGGQVLGAVAGGVQDVIDSSEEGIEFMVGPILPSEGTVVAFQVLPVIVFVSSVTAVLYYLNVLQWVVRIIGGGLRKVLGTTRPESLNATANIFLGQTEAPLVVRPYLARMSRSEFFAVMVGGLSTVAGSVMVGYALMGASLENLIAASFMAAPAGLLMAKIIMPEPVASTEAATERVPTPAGTGASETGAAGAGTVDGGAGTVDGGAGTVDGGHTGGGTDEDGTGADEDGGAEPDSDHPTNVIDAAATGASDGLRLALNVGAMLFAFVSLVALVNLVIGAAAGLFGLPDLTLQQILGYAFSPLMFVIGVPWDEAVQAGSFVGQKMVINEFLAFSEFGPRIGEFSEKTATIVTFALTGFANIGSLGILLGGLGGLVPSKRSWIARDGVRALLAGTLANLLSATIAGVLI